MTFVDTNIFVAALNQKDAYHEKCKVRPYKEFVKEFRGSHER